MMPTSNRWACTCLCVLTHGAVRSMLCMLYDADAANAWQLAECVHGWWTAQLQAQCYINMM